MRKWLGVVFLLLVLAPAQLHAAPTAPAANFDMSAFQNIPILHEGRVKPLETFARSFLLAFYGHNSLPNMTASAWLAELLFDPEKTYTRPVFNIANPDVVHAIGLEWRADHRYAFDEVSKALDAYSDTITSINAVDENRRTPAQRQLLGLYSRALAFAVLSESLSLLQPRFKIHDAALAQEFHLPINKELTFLDLLPLEQKITAAAKALKDRSPETFSAYDKELQLLALNYAELGQHQQATLFRIVPPQWNVDKDEWSSPWATLIDGHGSPQTAAYLDQWSQLALDYSKNDIDAWRRDAAGIEAKAYEFAGAHASSFKNKLEVFYHKADLFDITLGLYLLSFILVVMSFLSRFKPLATAAAIAMPVGLVLHFSNILMRVIIMSRPPVSTLYETTIFVSFVAVLLALIFEWKRRDTLGLTVGSVIGTVLLFISTRYAAEGDTMEMLVAVLNTNFWLATHVVAVTMGYGCSLVAGTLGHVYLINRVTQPKNTQRQTHILNMMLAVALIAVFFALLGTILGGIWADQSWGRFWGWDPKENGAMFIVLWLLWLLHGRIAGVLNALSFAALMVITNVVVALSWFGVNLLSVGLHSYGFTDSIAGNLALFCGSELLFALFFYSWLKHIARTARS